jgi:glycosyltransferase involved in cell wall biosynthesis
VSGTSAREVTGKPGRAGVLILDNELGMGGLEKKLYDFIARVDSDRFSVVVCCLKEGGYFKDKLAALGVPLYERLLRHKFDVLAFRELSRIIAEEEIDLIYTFGHPNTVILSYLAKARGLVRRVVVSFHATGSATGGRLVRPYLHPFLKKADVFLAVAESHKRYLSEVEHLPAERIEVIHNGVDIERYRPARAGDREALRAAFGIPVEDTVATAVASLKPIKRIDLLLRAAARTLAAVPSLRVVVAGDGRDRAGLEALAAELGMSDRVRFMGVRDDVESVLRMSDMLVLSSRTEAFPNVVLEAMASGLPVVSTDVGSVREMIDESCGLIVRPEDEDALAEAIGQLAADPEMRRRLGRRGREVVEERFTLEAMCTKRERLFERLLAVRGA